MASQESPSILSQIAKMLYAPRKAYAQIKENPRMLGPFIILVLFVFVNMGATYILLSKYYVEQTAPSFYETDLWTENATLWTSASGATITENFVDFINGSIYGNRSIEFLSSESTSVTMELNNIGTINCEGASAYKNLSLRTRITNPAGIPQNVSIYLYSSNTSAHFYASLTEDYANNTVGLWNNLTLQLATADWISGGNDANWADITGLKLEFAWLESSNMTLQIDGLFFRGVYRTPLELLGTSYLLSYLMVGITKFVIQWFAISVVAYLIINAFGTKALWRPVLVLVGFAIITMLAQAIVNVALFSNTPRLHYPLEYFGGVGQEGEIAYELILEQTWLLTLISGIVQMVVYIWTVALCAMGIRVLTEQSWVRSILISVVALFASIAVGIFLGV